MKKYTENAVRAELDKRIKKAGGMAQFGKLFSLDRRYIEQIVKGKRPINPAILESMEFEKKTENIKLTYYVKKKKEQK